MAESEPQERNYDNMEKMVDLNKDLGKLLDEMEKLTAKIPGLVVSVEFVVHATWMAYHMVAIRTNPDLTNSMKHLEDAFLRCKEQMEKKWQEVLMESKGEEQNKE